MNGLSIAKTSDVLDSVLLLFLFTCSQSILVIFYFWSGRSLINAADFTVFSCSVARKRINITFSYQSSTVNELLLRGITTCKAFNFIMEKVYSVLRRKSYIKGKRPIHRRYFAVFVAIGSVAIHPTVVKASTKSLHKDTPRQNGTGCGTNSRRKTHLMMQIAFSGYSRCCVKRYVKIYSVVSKDILKGPSAMILLGSKTTIEEIHFNVLTFYVCFLI